MKVRFHGPVVGGAAGRDLIVLQWAPSCLTPEELDLVRAWRDADDEAKRILRAGLARVEAMRASSADDFRERG